MNNYHLVCADAAESCISAGAGPAAAAEGGGEEEAHGAGEQSHNGAADGVPR